MSKRTLLRLSWPPARHRAGPCARRTIAIEWKPQDCWIGVFWKSHGGPFGHGLDVWVCLVPMLPIHYERWTDV